jgi:SH2 domain
VRWSEFWEALGEFVSSRSLGNDRNRLNLMALLRVPPENGELATVSMSAFAHLLAWFGPLDAHFLERIGRLCAYPWFHGRIERERAESLLAAQSAGTFLVRLSTRPAGGYTVSQTLAAGTASSPPKLRHVRLQHRADGGFTLGTRAYSSLLELVADNGERLRSACPGSMFHQELIDGGYAGDL